jgi:hypothetical protein
MSIFSVEIMRPGKFGLNTSATLEMPVTWSEFQDAKQKARITDDRVIYSYQLRHCKYDWLRAHIPEKGNLLEINLLAARIKQYIKDDLDVFEAMVEIEVSRNKNNPIPLPRLINLTFNIDNYPVASNITNDAELGKFLYENDFLNSDDVATVQMWLDYNRPMEGLFDLLGYVHRSDNGGAFTNTGRYVEYDGDINEVYAPGSMAYFERSGAPIVLKLFKDDKTIVIDLPVISNSIKEMLGVKSFSECSYECTECLIPAAKDWLNTEQDFTQANALAVALNNLERFGGIVEYKALLEVAECNDLSTAIQLADGIEDFQLITECYGPDDYVFGYYAKKQAFPDWIDLSKILDLNAFGRLVMEHENAANTSYGILRRKDGSPIFSQNDAPCMNMEMGGLSQ